jgi:hypothetical protein
MQMTDNRPRCSRRRALVGGATLATALSGSTAGCLSLLPPVGQEVRFGRVDVPTEREEDVRYRQWMPAPAEIPNVETDVDIETMHWGTVTPGDLGRDTLGGAFDIVGGLALSVLDYVGYEFEHYDFVHSFDALGVVAEGDVDPAVVTETVLDGGYRRDGTYHGWDLFDRTDTPRTLAVSDSAVVMSRGEDRTELIETLLDAGDGRIERYPEASDTFATFAERMGAYPSIIQGFGAAATPAEPEHAAMGYTFDDGGAYYIYHHQYQPGETPSSDEIERHLESDMPAASQALSVDIQREKQHVEIQMRIDSERVARTGTTDTQPHVMWSIEDTPEIVTVRLEAGDSIPADQLMVEPDGTVVEGLEDGTVLEPGDEFTVDVESLPAGEDDVSVVYRYAGTEHDKATLIHYTPDELDTT